MSYSLQEELENVSNKDKLSKSQVESEKGTESNLQMANFSNTYADPHPNGTEESEAASNTDLDGNLTPIFYCKEQKLITGQIGLMENCIFTLGCYSVALTYISYPLEYEQDYDNLYLNIT